MSPTQELATIDEQEAALAAAAREDIANDGDLTVPVLKVTQALTAEVSEGDAKAGEFLNALTLENFGDEIDLVVVAYKSGRFYKDKVTKKSYGTEDDVAPSHWPEEYAGKPFLEIDDAEERYRERANDGDIEWGSGPPIQTTHNFIGFVVGSEIPVRLSLKSSATPAARKIKTLLRFSPTFWSHVFTLKTVAEKSSADEPYFGITVKKGGPTPTDIKQDVLSLAQAVRSERISGVDADQLDDKRAEPAKPEDALDV